jgi:hypothetical protein
VNEIGGILQFDEWDADLRSKDQKSKQYNILSPSFLFSKQTTDFLFWFYSIIAILSRTQFSSGVLFYFFLAHL